MARLRGRVVLIDFWTYTCINCLRTLPYLKAWDARYRDQGLTIVGVHTPEFAFERKQSNVRGAIGRQGLRYPVVQDNEYGTWNAFGNQYWPAKYLIDARGQVRYVHFGEGEYEETEAAIRTLLSEAGDRSLGAAAKPRGRIETVGAPRDAGDVSRQRARAELLAGRPEGRHAHVRRRGAGLAAAERLQPRRALARRPRVRPRGARRDDQRARRRQGRLPRAVIAGDRPRHVRVELDGRPIAAADAGDDVRDGVVTVRRQRLYNLVRLDALAEHVLTLRFDPGVSGFAFTFG